MLSVWHPEFVLLYGDRNVLIFTLYPIVKHITKIHKGTVNRISTLTTSNNREHATISTIRLTFSIFIPFSILLIHFISIFFSSFFFLLLHFQFNSFRKARDIIIFGRHFLFNGNQTHEKTQYCKHKRMHYVVLFLLANL